MLLNIPTIEHMGIEWYRNIYHKTIVDLVDLGIEISTIVDQWGFDPSP